MKNIIRKLENYLKNFIYFYSILKRRIFIALGLSLLSGLFDGFGLAMFLPLLQLVDDASKTVEPEQMGKLSFIIDGFYYLGFELNIHSILIVILVFFSIKGVVKYFEGFYRVVMEQRFIRQIRFSNIDLLSNLQFKAFIDSDSGKIQNTFSGEVERVLQAYRAYFWAFQYGILVLVYIFLAFMANAQFAILVAIGGVLTNLIFKIIYKKTKQLSKALTNDAHNFQGLLIQNVSNFKYLKATGLINAFAKKLKDLILLIEDKQRKVGVLISILNAIREPIVMLVVVIVILIQIYIFSQSLALILISLLFFYRSLTFLMGMQNYWNTFLSVSGSLENMTNFTKELLQNQEQQGNIVFERFKHSLQLENLCFNFGNEYPIINDVSFVINRNETVAVVGESGSGKTTLMNVICGLLPPSKGKYLIDGKESFDYNLISFQNKIGYITQEPVIFNDTLFNNVTFWDEPTPMNIARFNEAIKIAAIESFVNNLPNKEQTYLGNNGIMISGGQKQRISIARELYKEIDFIIMDEATSALDSETEKNIQENIDRLKGKYTLIIVAHRLSTIKSADKIINIKGGEIESIGTFEYLLSNSVSFKKIVELQNVKSEDILV